MNTKTKQHQKQNQRKETRQGQVQRKRGPVSTISQEHELPEMRMTR